MYHTFKPLVGVEITSDDAGDYAAPHTWRHFKRAPKEVMIIGSFGNHNQWKLPLVNNLYYYSLYNFAEKQLYHQS